MNYRDAASRFWRMHMEKAFKHVDTALYMFLLNEWQSRQRPEWFDVPTRYLEIAVPISRKSLAFSREELRRRGLIDYDPGTGSGNARYSVCVPDCVSYRNSSVSQRNTNRNTKETQNGICVPDCVSEGNTNEFVFPSETQSKRKVSPIPPLKENNNIINNINNNAREIKAENAMELLAIGEIVDRLKDMREWKESMMRTFAMSEPELVAALDLYPDHCINLGEPRKTMQEAKRHVYNWLMKQQSRQQAHANETKRQDRFSERRGTDPSANSAEDYTSTF